MHFRKRLYFFAYELDSFAGTIDHNHILFDLLSVKMVYFVNEGADNVFFFVVGFPVKQDVGNLVVFLEKMEFFTHG